MPNKSPALDDVFHALGDPTRRAVLARLCRGPATVSELASPFAMALPSFMQHLAVMEASGLVTTRKHGRSRICEARLQPLTGIERWIAQQKGVWERRLDQFDEYVTSLKQQQSEDDR